MKAFPKPRAPFHITLECGCTFTARDVPSASQFRRYACPSGMGHGYQVPWVRAYDTIHDRTYIYTPRTS